MFSPTPLEAEKPTQTAEVPSGRRVLADAAIQIAQHALSASVGLAREQHIRARQLWHAAFAS